MRTQKIAKPHKISENKDLEKARDEIVPGEIEKDSPEITHGMIEYLNNKYRFWVKMKEGQDAATLMLVARKRDSKLQ